MTFWTVLWILWIVSFFVIEGFAIANKTEGDTLSEHVRKWFNVKENKGRAIFLWVWAGFSVWFLVHIAFSLA